MAVASAFIIRERTAVTGLTPTTNRVVITTGESDPVQIRSDLTSGGTPLLPPTLDGLPLSEISQRMISQDDQKWQNVGQYKIEERPPTPVTNDEQVSFKITGIRQSRITYSQATVFTEGIAETGYNPPPNFNRGIEWDGQRFQGTDIPPPQFTYQVTKYVPRATVTNTWIKERADQCYTTNQAAFRGRLAQETLFVGLSGNERNADDYALTYDFWVRPRRINVDVAGIVIPAIEGWDHLWQLWEGIESNNRIGRRVVAAYVENLFKASDFSTLGVTV